MKTTSTRYSSERTGWTIPSLKLLIIFFHEKKLRLEIKSDGSEPANIASFEDVLKLESKFVDIDKIVTVQGHFALYISEDRDIFILAARVENLSKLVDDITLSGGKTYSSLVMNRVVEPRKHVKDCFDYWASLNFEISGTP